MTYSNQYVAPGTTPKPLYETVLKTGCIYTSLAATDLNVVGALWDEFQTLKIVAAKTDPNAPDVVLTYWNDWEKSQLRQTTRLLLENHEGSCVSWSQFFLDVVEAQGISGGKMDVVASKAANPPEGLLVANWNVGPNGANNTDPLTKGVYPYVDTLTTVGQVLVKAGGKWDYGWNAANSSIFFDKTNYIQAQGESARAQPPLALFANHVLAEITIAGKTLLFDPSYGKCYKLSAPLTVGDAVKPMDAAIPYFWTADPTPGGAGRILIRANSGGDLVLKAQLDSKARLQLSDKFEHDNPQP